MNTTSQIYSDNQRRIVLVADDDEGMRDLTARTVAQIGLLPVKAQDGISALDLANEYKNLLICAVLDIQMPFLNGAEVAHTIRQSIPNLAIVLISGGIPPHLTDRINQLRQFTMIHKPFPPLLLREVLEQIVGTPPAPSTNSSCHTL